MASKLSACYFSHGGFTKSNSKNLSFRSPYSTHLHHRLHFASSQHKLRQQVNKVFPLQLQIRANQQSNDEVDVKFENSFNHGPSKLSQEDLAKNGDFNVFNSVPDLLPKSEAPNSPSSSSEERGLNWWIQIAFFIVCVLGGQSVGMLLGRLYFNEGGKSKWMATLVQYAGFPLLLPLYRILPKETTPTVTSVNTLSPLKTALLYTFFGLYVAAVGVMYSIGLQYVPVSTFSLLCASQLAFNAFFSFFLNSQKFTPYIINSLVLLTISSVLLVIQSGSSVPEGVSKANYVFGFICAIVYPISYGLLLSLTEFAFQKILKKQNFEAILDLLLRQSSIASFIAVIGILATGDWNNLKIEMDQFGYGKISYVMMLICTALSWQVYNIGLFGLIVKVSSLFSNVVATVGLPIVPALAVIFFHDIMDGIKVVAMLLAIWGFVSYAYDQYLEERRSPETESSTASYTSGAFDSKN